MANREQIKLKTKDSDAEKTAFERFEIELKSNIFGVMFLMLKTEHDSFLQLIVFLIIEACQLFSLVFNPYINFPWKGYSVSSYFQDILQVFQIAYWCTFLDSGSYLAIFYTGVGVVALLVVDIGYAFYTVSNKHVTVMWPVKILRSVLSLLVTVLFMPFTDLFLSIMQCNYDKAVPTHQSFSDIKCWKEMHILHAAFGIISTIIFVTVSLVVVITMFETRSTSNDPSARTHSRNEFWQNVFKFVSLLITTFFIHDSYRWFIVFLFLTGSILIYLKNRREKPYYSDLINNIVDIINGLFMWSCFCLIIVMLSEDSDFNGGMQVFIMSVPLIGIIILTKQDKRNKLLLKIVQDIDNPEDWLLKIRYYIQIVLHKEISREASVQLNGFMFHHEESCTDPTCPLKLYTTNVLAILKEKKKKQTKSGAENFGLLMAYANQLFAQGAAKFPRSSVLHISYALFLKDRINNKSTAINELTLAEKSDPPFDEQFLVYRYRKILEDEMTEVQEGGAGMDVVTMLAYENYLQQFREAIERSAYLHMEFWVELLELEPDLGKLDATGIKINLTMLIVQDGWERLQKLNPNSPKAIKVYFDYLSEILNDSEEAAEIISRIKDNEIGKLGVLSGDAEALGMGDICATMGGADGTPCIVASGEQGKVGEIIQYNMSACRLFGYTKAEMSMKKVSFLMPELYAKFHDGFLQRGINNAEDMGATTTKTEKFVLGKHKSGYLVPLSLTARVVISVKQGAFFVGTFKNDKKIMNVTYLLLDGQQNIIGVTSKALSILHLTNHILKNYRVSAQILCPSILDKTTITQITNSNGATVDFFLPDLSSSGDAGGINISYTQVAPIPNDSISPIESPSTKLRLNASKKSIKANCILTEQSFNGITQGYIMRVEQIEDNMLMLAHAIEAEPRHPNFQFVFDPVEMKYVQQDCEEDAQRIIAEERSSYVNILKDHSDRSLTPGRSEDSRINTSMISQPQPISKVQCISQIQSQLEQKRKEYGEGIETYRLVRGKREKIEAPKNKLLERQKEEQKELEEAATRAHRNDRQDDMYSILKSKKVFFEALHSRAVPSSVKKLLYTGYAIVLGLLVLASVEFGICVSEFKTIGENISLIKNSYFQIAAQMSMVYFIGKIVLLKKTVAPFLASPSLNTDIQSCKTRIEKSLDEYYDLQSIISLSKIGLSDKHKDLFENKMVYLYYADTGDKDMTDKYYTLIEATQQMASEVFTVESFTNYAKYTIENEDVFFTLYNGFYDLYTKMEASSNYYVEELNDRSSSKTIVIIIVFSISMTVLIVSVLVLFPVVWGVSDTRLSVLLLFFDIPLGTIRELKKRCEYFLTLNNEDNTDSISMSDSNPLAMERSGHEGISLTGVQTHRRKYKNNATSNYSFYLYFLIGMVVIGGYFSINFACGFVYLKNIKAYSRELNITAVSHSKTAYVISVFQNFLGHSRVLTMTETETFNLLALSKISELYSIAQEMQISHNENGKIFSSSYQKEFINIMRDNLCEYKTRFGISFDCDSFLVGTTKEGLHPVIVNFIEAIREMLTEYKVIEAKNLDSSEKNSTINSTLLNSNTYSNIEKSIFDIVDPALRYLINQLYDSYDSMYSTEITQRIITYIIFLICFFIAYLSFWSPFTNRLCDEIWRTRSMLTLIPYDICKNIQSIKNYLSQQENDSVSYKV